MKLILDEKDVEKAIKFYIKNELKLIGTLEVEMKTYPTNHVEVRIDDKETPF